MKTTDLIDMMAQEGTEPSVAARSLPLGVLAGVVISALLLLSFWGVRSDFGSVIVEPLVLLKTMLPLITAAPCLLWVTRSQRPDYSLNRQRSWLLIPVLLVIGLLLFALQAMPSAQWLAAIKGETLFACLLSIPLLAAPILACLLWVMRQGAPSNPSRTGAFCGIAAGCLATSIYAFHCFEDNPAFYGVWYSVGIVLVGIVGQQLGKKVLKW